MGWHESDLLPEILKRQLIVSLKEHSTSIHERILTASKIFWLSIPVYNVAMVLAKVSIFLQYPQVFQTKSMRILCRAIIAILAVFGLWAVLSALLHCMPVAKSWHPHQLAGYCVNNEILWFINAGVYIVTDLAIMVTPISASFSLYLSLRQKLALCVMFALGGLYVQLSLPGVENFTSLSTNCCHSVLIVSVIRLQSIRVLSTSSDFTCEYRSIAGMGPPLTYI